MKTIQKDIREGTFRPVYLIFGEEAYLRQSLKQRLRGAIVGDDDMNYLYLEGKDTDPREIMEMAETLPFFAQRRLIIAENTGFFRRDVGELADYLERMPETTCLVFMEEEVDKRNKLYKRVQKLGYAVECGRQTPQELARWAARGLAQAGKKITAADMNFFLARTGEDMENIWGELEKLIGYTGEREVVTRADIEAITTQQISGRIFEMIDAIALRNQGKALELYYDLLLLKEPPMRIMVLIARQFHAILQVKEMREEGLNRARIAERGKWRPFLVDRYMRQASRFGKEELERFVARCVEMDEAVKRGDLRDGMAAEMLIVTLTGK